MVGCSVGLVIVDCGMRYSRSVAKAFRRLLGICLGLQLRSRRSEAGAFKLEDGRRCLFNGTQILHNFYLLEPVRD